MREQAWRGDAEAQQNYLNVGARRADSVKEVLAEVDRMNAMGVWHDNRRD
ncbi:MAG: hypothetical protein PHU07_13195 [Acidocella sp.]|nr:hypothetical protein [Acidocella sp.]